MSWLGESQSSDTCEDLKSLFAVGVKIHCLLDFS